MIHDRVRAFCARFGLASPILLAPMAGACPPALSAAVVKAGGMGGCGALLMDPPAIRDWVDQVRVQSSGPFQINLWIPDPAPRRDADGEARVRAFLSSWGPSVPENAGDAVPPGFQEQCKCLLEVAPPVVSSVMGLFPKEYVARIKASGISWFATASTVAEAKAAERAGADAIISQGFEAGGHRGAFDADTAERTGVGLLALLPAVVDAVSIPVIATGGIADGRGVAAALVLGASAVQIGTGFLRCPEAGIVPAWADLIAATAPEGTTLSRVFSGRAGRSVTNAYARAATAPDAPPPAPYPVQRAMTAAMRTEASRLNDGERLQAWAGQAAWLARSEPAADVVQRLWSEAADILGFGRWKN